MAVPLSSPSGGLVISSGPDAEPSSNAAREDALNGAPVQVSEGLADMTSPLAWTR